MKHGITTVNTLIERLPVGISVRFKQILLCDLNDIKRGTVSCNQVVRTKFSPHQHSFQTIGRLQLRITGIDTTVNVSLFCPIILQNDLIQRNDAQKIIT